MQLIMRELDKETCEATLFAHYLSGSSVHGRNRQQVHLQRAPGKSSLPASPILSDDPWCRTARTACFFGMRTRGSGPQLGGFAMAWFPESGTRQHFLATLSLQEAATSATWLTLFRIWVHWVHDPCIVHCGRQPPGCHRT